ncbi:FxsA family protein [Paenibacillus beijingensis]|uniref:Exlusion protein FxsA n=1 Tax=Paenibacillus beijingensis TaxID=1126833 RepID=A0A0D5NKW5_9BACL|nr:FxsA family protein [Paenibacillus beijingensis]AJY75994.1 hypothetical protein VN24_17330 [Paenibacillus beijingensis]
MKRRGRVLQTIVLAVIVAAVLEIGGIMIVSHWIGGAATFGLMLATAVAGALAARSEGRKALTEAKRQMQTGQPPGRAILDGLCILGGGLLLMLPGFISDLVGLTLLLPPTRLFYRQLLLRWLEKVMRGGGSGPFIIGKWQGRH